MHLATSKSDVYLPQKLSCDTERSDNILRLCLLLSSHAYWLLILCGMHLARINIHKKIKDLLTRFAVELSIELRACQTSGN
jgi:hypothetical protein